MTLEEINNEQTAALVELATTEANGNGQVETDAFELDRSVVWRAFMAQAYRELRKSREPEDRQIALLLFAARCFAAGRLAAERALTAN